MTELPDPFEALVREEGTAHFKMKQRAAAKREATRESKVKIVQSEADAPMKLGPMEQKLVDTTKQYRSYMRGKRAELKALLSGTEAERWRGLVTVLRALTLEAQFTLVDYVKSQRWFYESDLQTRQTALSLISGRLITLNEENGYAPFDDALPGEAPTVFQIIRDELQVMT